MRPLNVLLLLPLLAACRPDDEDDQVQGDLEVTVALAADMATAVDVSWTTEAGAESWVEYGVDGSLTHRVEAGDSSSTTHQARLVGAGTLADVSFRAVSLVDGEEVAATGQIQTGNLPSSFPSVEMEVLEPDLMEDTPYVLTAAMSFDYCGMFLSDREGRIVWYVLGPQGEVYMASFLSRAGDRFLWNVFSTEFDEEVGFVRAADPMSGEISDTRTPMGHHHFQELPDGTLTYLAIDVRNWYDADVGAEVPVVGDAVYELAPGATEPTLLWNAWDWAEVTKSNYWDIQFYPQGKDWTHANAINWVEENDTYLLSIANLDTVLELDGETGEVLRQFGGEGGYTFAERSLPWGRPHEAKWTPEGNLLVNTTKDQVKPSYVAEYAVDDATQTLTEGWTWGAERNMWVLAQGQSERLSNGNTLANMGTSGSAYEVTPDGTVTWEAHTDSGFWFGLIHFLDQIPGVTPLE